MKLEGSCHCGAVTFTVNSRTPYPFNHCYCSKCRKTGGGGYSINIMGEYPTLEVTGEENISVYRSKNNHRGAYEADGLGFSRRHFCKTCGTPLWIYNPNYAEFVYPCATAIDTPLPRPEEMTHHMLGYKSGLGAGSRRAGAYPLHLLPGWRDRAVAPRPGALRGGLAER